MRDSLRIFDGRLAQVRGTRTALGPRDYGRRMEDIDESGGKRMRLRYAGRCRVCGADLPARSDAIYESQTKSVRCLKHQDDRLPVVVSDFDVATEDESSASVEPGTPGASARREFERRVVKREQQVRRKHPKIGGLILAMNDDPQSTRAWDVGARGEERLGNALNQMSSETLRVLHDRRIPGTRANIDHIVVVPSGIYVIDSKKYNGRPNLRVEGGILRPRVEKVVVGGRDRTSLVDGVLKQVDVVREVVDGVAPVLGVLCFIEADWPLIGGAFTTRGVDVLWPKKLYGMLTMHGPMAIDEIASVHRTLARALPIS